MRQALATVSTSASHDHRDPRADDRFPAADHRWTATARIRSLVGALNFQVEFFSGREFGLRVRGDGLVLLNRSREVLAGLTRADTEEIPPEPVPAARGPHPEPAVPRRRV